MNKTQSPHISVNFYRVCILILNLWILMLDSILSISKIFYTLPTTKIKSWLHKFRTRKTISCISSFISHEKTVVNILGDIKGSIFTSVVL